MPAPTRPEVAKTYNAISESFDRTRVTPWPEVTDFVEGLPPRSSVADLGCGNGRHIVVMAPRGHCVVGVDAASLLIAKARLRAPQAAYAIGDLCHLPLRDATVDAALMVAAIHHLPSEGERLQAGRELRRILRPRGRALVTAWSFERSKTEAGVERAGPEPEDVWVPWGADGQGLRRFYHLFRDGELPGLILKAGLRVERYFKSRDNHFVVAERDG